ncbi:antibiotic biosynthesis monooxygenase [Pseudofrankia sp. BMG5.37]|uniref:antibiotic biosynthesis monooxygenase n=1 Tax=Pseudofrankia sp. BMG5.37 TaxID=3050035 RepID=UPI0028949552|nr:antibiotic biosynthesis monooxygenase [Pseudofrankia sp. BMG5.37]MDT3441292.1 antibiotic biosynthesis monooxygenase [Pseudofrankia sp. BMG5.37]
MATIPWSTPSAAGPSVTAAPTAASTGTPDPSAGAPVVMVSRFTITSRRHTVSMLRHALRVRRALLAAPGALGVSLVAHPMRGEYWTLSGWTDRRALDGFVRTPEHRAAMRTLGPTMADSTFVFWAHDAAAQPPTWAEATARVDAERSRPKPAPDPTA